MPTLTNEIKMFIVNGLACYDTPTQVAEAVKANFNVEITRQHVYAYDPNASQHMAPRWRELHAATRQALLREQAEIGIAHRAVRLRRLDRLECRSERNNVLTALKCLEMAAKECGGMYENRKPIVLQPALPQHAMPEAPAPQPVATQPAAPQPPRPLPAPPRPLMQQPSLPARTAPQAPAPRAPAPQPQATPPQPMRPTPLLSVPLPVMPQTVMPQAVMPQADMPAPSATRPLGVLAQAPQPPALPEGRPLNRQERYLAYVRDSHARDRAVRAQALLESGRSPTVPPAS